MQTNTLNVRKASLNFEFINNFIWIMLSGYLLVDSLTGAIQLYLGSNLKLSLLFKAPLIALMITSLFVLNTNSARTVLLVLLFFLIGPSYQVLKSGNITYFFNDFSYSLKFLMPLLVYIYAYELFNYKQTYYFRYAKKALFFMAAIILLNLSLGFLGLGYSTYGGTGGLGVSGFFSAGNELGGLVIIAMSVVLHYVWNRYSLAIYLLCCSIALILGISIATKTAVIGALLTTVLIPIINERTYLFKLTKLKLMYLTIIVVISTAVGTLLFEMLNQTDFLARIVWAYEKFGLLGLLFSGRQEFVVASLETFMKSSEVVEMLFGIGVSGVATDIAKYSAEVDPIDVFVWFGFVGATMMFLLNLFFIRDSFQKLKSRAYFFAPAVLLANVLLFVTACISGHIWTSGMLGISWGILNALNLVAVEKEAV